MDDGMNNVKEQNRIDVRSRDTMRAHQYGHVAIELVLSHIRYGSDGAALTDIRDTAAEAARIAIVFLNYRTGPFGSVRL